MAKLPYRPFGRPDPEAQQRRKENEAYRDTTLGTDMSESVRERIEADLTGCAENLRSISARAQLVSNDAWIASNRGDTACADKHLIAARVNEVCAEGYRKQGYPESSLFVEDPRVRAQVHREWLKERAQ